ncbi:thioesterase domain-containing protein, partial [Pseudogulbenkiania ferrooxidans]
ESGGERLVPMRTGGGREPIVALPGAGGGALSLQLLSRELGDSQPFYCVEPAGGASSVEETAAANIRLLDGAGLQGPCRLLGYSNGGVVAYEMARQLLAMGRQVSSVILLDTLRPDLRGYGMAA